MTAQAVASPITIASAKPLKELTPEEKKARWKALSQKSRYADQTTVIGEPGVHYFWANNTDDPEIIRLESIGYWIATEPNAADVLAGKAKPKIQAAGLKEDGRYTRGDVVLMACSQEDYEFFLLDTEQRHDEGMMSIPEEFISEATAAGAPTFTVSK